MRTLIAVPCMDTVQTPFFKSILALIKPEGTRVGVISGSLIYDARNQLAAMAINGKYDRVLWLDSDMVFAPDMLRRMGALMDEDPSREMVAGLFFTRRYPIMPCIYSFLGERNGNPGFEFYADYPRDSLFEVQGCGFGAVLMTTDLIRRVADKYGHPFSPIQPFGEDFSFCIRARELGAKIWCDSSIKIGHVGLSIFDEEAYLLDGDEG